jgi:hypothetical protein
VRRVPKGSSSRYCLGLVAVLLLTLVLAACSRDGNGDQAGVPIGWTPIMPTLGPPTATIPAPTAEPTTPPTATVEASQDATEAEDTPEQTSTAEETSVATNRLTAEQLAQFKPNELGSIPVLEYHEITTDEGKADQFNRPVSKFRVDLQWLYDHNFFVVPMHDLITNSINAPAGKHPVVLSFDDSTIGQFRYEIADDDTATIDPNSAVAILEDFFNAHPDFGRGGFFSVWPNYCFDWDERKIHDEQTPLCQDKLKWLLDHGYEIGNDTFNPQQSLLDVDNDTFKQQIGKAIVWLQSMVPEIQADILNMPFGEYPDSGKHPQQWQWLRDGFDYQGTPVKIIGAVTTGNQPSYAPVSTNWDPMFVYRIPTCECEGGFSTWFPQFEAQPELLYTSDGNPSTITVPNNLPGNLAGTLNEANVEGKELIKY